MKHLVLALLLTVTAHAADNIDVYFSPSGGCTEAVVSEQGKAKKTVLVEAYSFTSTPIATVLVDAHNRGVNVTVILDKSQRTEEYLEADFLLVSPPTSIPSTPSPIISW